MNGPRLALQAATELGLGPTTLYALYQVMLRSGWFRWRTPRYAWDDRPLSFWTRRDIAPASFLESSQPRFFFEGDGTLRSTLRRVAGEGLQAAQAEAEAVRRGELRLFGQTGVNLGFPPNWRTSAPFAGLPSVRASGDRHWAASGFPGDIKLLWEPSRFGWVYPLVRAYLGGEDVEHITTFWALLESWRRANPPNSGPNWQSAQEVALRLLALIFAWHGFADVWRREPGRAALFLQTLAVHAERIPPTLVYARAQQNNHLLVEAAALYTAGLLFPEFRSAKAWRRLGRRWLIHALRAQVFEDGGYIQHSANYHRLALDVGVWAARLAEVNEDPLPDTALDALRRLTGALAALVDPRTGRAPNFGPNDGAQILPLTSCAFEDYRPTVQAASVALLRRAQYPAGMWDEALVWLGLESAAGARRSGEGEVPTKHAVESLPQAGLHFLRGGRGWGMLRCARFRSRPGHSDQLHFELWRDGEAFAGDPGTYLYDGQPPWDNGLATADVHNTLIIDGHEPMRRAGRFLWLGWAQGRVLGRWRSTRGGLEVLAAEHDGYGEIGVAHRRLVVRAGDDLWLVADEVSGVGEHTLRLGWLLPYQPWRLEGASLALGEGPDPATVALEVSGGKIGLYRAGARIAGDPIAGAAETWGWRATAYAVKEPALRLVAEVRKTLPVRLMTSFAFSGRARTDLRLGWRPVEAARPGLLWAEWADERLEL
jgi:hypothetical protein